MQPPKNITLMKWEDDNFTIYQGKLMDTSKINNLGWRAKVELEKGIIKTIQEFKNLTK